MKKSKFIKSITIGAILSTISVILQAAPIYLPVVGLALSPLSTIPIAVAGYLNVFIAIYAFLCTFLLLLMISIEEALIFLFATGLIGLTISIFYNRQKIIISILTSSISLTIGLLILTYIIEIAGFKEMASNFYTPIVILIFFLFSIFYTVFINIFIRKLIKYLYFINKNL